MEIIKEPSGTVTDEDLMKVWMWACEGRYDRVQKFFNKHGGLATISMEEIDKIWKEKLTH